MDNLSQLFDIKSIISALTVAAILGIIALIWKKRDFLVRKIKNISSFLRLPQAKEFILDVYQRIFQSYTQFENKPSLQDYMKSFGRWESKTRTGITLNIKIGSEQVIYENVVNFRVSPIDPFGSLYNLEIELIKPGYALYTRSILGVSKEEIFKLARLTYYREIVESENNENVIDN